MSIKETVALLNNLNKRSQGKLIKKDIDDYVNKLEEYATWIIIQRQNRLVAFIAYYDNDKEKNTAYLSMVAVRQECQGMGYGKNLIQASIENLRKVGFYQYKLEVNSNNENAIGLYKSLGFVVAEKESVSLYMVLEL